MRSLTPEQKDRAVELLRIIVLPPYGCDENVDHDRIFQSAINEANRLLGGPQPRAPKPVRQLIRKVILKWDRGPFTHRDIAEEIHRRYKRTAYPPHITFVANKLTEEGQLERNNSRPFTYTPIAIAEALRRRQQQPEQR